LYGVNLATSTPSQAADEVQYAAKVFGSRLKGIEIGNEPDIYRGQFGFTNWGPSQYIAKWLMFAGAVQQVEPGVCITAPALATLGNVATWTVPLLAASSDICWVTQHHYIDNGQLPTATIDRLLGPDQALWDGLSALSSVTSRMKLTYRVAETNSFYKGGSPGVSNSFASALWAIQYQFAIAQNGGTGANFHGGPTGHTNSVIADDNGVVAEVRPIYYGLLFLRMGGPGQPLRTTTDAHGLNVRTHALLASDGSLSIYLLNDDPTHPISVTVDAGRPVSSATRLLMTAPSEAATSGVTIGGSPVGLDGTFAPQPGKPMKTSGQLIDVYVPAASAALVQAK